MMVRPNIFGKLCSGFRPTYSQSNFGCFSVSRFASTATTSTPEPPKQGVKLRDDAESRIPKFVDPEVQKVLKELTGLEYTRVFRNRKLGQKIAEPKYSFMTAAQLREAMDEAHAKAETLLQMPPVMAPRNPINKVLSYDPQIATWDLTNSTLLFMDISMGISERNRLMVARDDDGTLRYASWEERDKLNRIYCPVLGREVKTPKMFKDLNILKAVLDRASREDNTYEFVLDRACLQMEPDDPLYIQTVELTYDTVNARGHHDYLKSTRHYGPMLFYLVRLRKVDNLLVHLLDQDRLQEASHVAYLFTLVFPESKSGATIKSAASTEDGAIDAITQYINNEAVLKAELQVHFDAFLERRRNVEDLEAGLREAHGI